VENLNADAGRAGTQTSLIFEHCVEPRRLTAGFPIRVPVCCCQFSRHRRGLSVRSCQVPGPGFMNGPLTSDCPSSARDVAFDWRSCVSLLGPASRSTTHFFNVPSPAAASRREFLRDLFKQHCR